MTTQTPTTQPLKQRSALPLVLVVLALLMLGGLLINPFLISIRPYPPHPISSVRTEIKVLEGGLADFYAHFGGYPPSRITLYATGEGWSGATEGRRSKILIRKFWPQFDFMNPVYPDGFFAEGETKKTLNGAECLVFFLGGVWDAQENLQGFSKNPRQPFSADGSRLGPFIEFDPSRLRDTNGNGLLEYLDPYSHQKKPFIYYSAYDGRGYDSADQTEGMEFYQPAPGAAWKPESYQIISPGRDGDYGPGGIYDPETADKDLTGPRKAERDNITNFSAGLLAD